MAAREAIEEAAAIRLRPILMTTAATVVAMVPLLIAGGAGAASRFDIGVVIAAGMTIGTMFTLFVTPAVYTYLARDHQKGRAARRRPQVAAEAAMLFPARASQPCRKAGLRRKLHRLMQTAGRLPLGRRAMSVGRPSAAGRRQGAIPRRRVRLPLGASSGLLVLSKPLESLDGVGGRGPMFKKLLIANRGEIACRIIETAKRLGHQDRGGLFRGRPRRAACRYGRRGRADRPGRMPPSPISTSTRSSPPPRRPARTRSIRATASCRRTPPSPGRSKRRASCLSGRTSRPSRRWATRSSRRSSPPRPRSRRCPAISA